MPSVLSVGFVASDKPSPSLQGVCAAFINEVNISGMWSMETDCGCKSTGCIERGAICLPRGNDAKVVFSVYDEDGDEFDISAAQEIVFVIADGEIIGGDVYAGGTVRIVRKLSDGGIVIAGTLYQFAVTIPSAMSATLPRSKSYYECLVISTDGLKKTVSAGIVKTDQTIAGGV